MNDQKRILLADDNPKDVELTMAALAESMASHDVVVSRDGVEALDFLYRRGQYATRMPGNPVLVLLDVKMPKMDGLEVLRIIKSDSLLRTIPVVMLTSSREEGDLAQSYANGANAYVVKPVSFQIFMNALKNTGCFWAAINEPPPPRSPDRKGS